MKCRPGCAACCIHISISSSIPGMEKGKAAGTRCINLRKNWQCALYETERYPAVCRNFQPSHEMCGEAKDHAVRYLKNLEELTR